MRELQDTEMESTPTIWAVGGGKGGVGKSVVSTILAFWLARKGKRTVLIDADLGGANLHTLLGIKSPPRTLIDFINRKFGSLEEICIDTEAKNLRLISGSSEVLSLANPHFSQKVKIIVLTPEPTSIQNAYIFVRNAVYRRLSRLSRKNPSLQTLVKIAMDPKNELQVRTVKELLQFIQESGGKDEARAIEKEIGEIRPAVITNMVRDNKEKNAGRIVQIVAEKYLMIQSTNLGSVSYDRQIFSMVSDMVSLLKLEQSSHASANIYEILTKLLGG